jgi:uncharacterized OB-fold protein
MAPDQLAGTLGPEHVINGASGDLRLKGGRCAACGGLAFPKPGICSGCLCEDIADVPLAPEGVLYAYSVIHVGRRDDLPYAVGYVDLADGVRVFAELSRSHGLRPDMPVAIAITPKAAEPEPSYRFAAVPVEAR